MQTQLSDAWPETGIGGEARELIGKCVHCGFCNATCPTYRLLGDELDGPRGRIYLVKQMLEGNAPTRRTREHLDRCLTCRACETTCPSGVQFGRLVDLGRQVVDAEVPRPAHQRVQRWLLREILVRPALFAPLLWMARRLRPLLPRRFARSVPPVTAAGAWPTAQRTRRVLLLAGCVQPSLSPSINAATARVLDAAGIEVIVPPAAACCGALQQHLDDPQGALVAARRNIDAWWPLLQAGAEAIVTNASGCGAQVEEYGHLLRDDPQYADRARIVSARAVDVAELVAVHADELVKRIRRSGGERTVFHPPCTLQHGQRVRGVVEGLLARLGAAPQPFADAFLCCGSAGTYSLLQPAIATTLRDHKLAALQAARPDVILSANVGCITHLGAAAGVPVKHWIEWVDERLLPTVG